MRLLVVDDDRALREVLRRALTLAGYEVRLTDSGAGALSEAVSSVPDAVVLDVGLPDIDGLEVCRLLRREGNRVPVLMLTARDAVSDRIDGLDAGADDYLVKPFDIDELKARLRALLRRARGDSELDGAPSFGGLRLDHAAGPAGAGAGRGTAGGAGPRARRPRRGEAGGPLWTKRSRRGPGAGQTGTAGVWRAVGDVDARVPERRDVQPPQPDIPDSRR